MAKAYIKATKQFTRRIGRQTVVGHPKHPDIRGRYAEVDEGQALNDLVSSGSAERISKAAYLKAMAGAEDVSTGENLTRALAGKAPKASPTMSDGQLHAMAADRGVNISKAKDRTEIIKLINAKKVDVGAESIPDNAWSQTAGDTRDTTAHPQRSGIHADVTQEGMTDRMSTSQDGLITTGEESLVDDDDAAPTGSKAETPAPAGKTGAARSSSSRSSASARSAPKASGAATGNKGTGTSTEGTEAAKADAADGSGTGS